MRLVFLFFLATLLILATEAIESTRMRQMSQQRAGRPRPPPKRFNTAPKSKPRTPSPRHRNKAPSRQRPP